jgi:hypothetical protein
MTNQVTRESVMVNFNFKHTIAVNGYTRWIDYLDTWSRVVYLNDGSSWNMSWFDSSVVNKWAVGDIVVIGVNDGWLKGSNPNILINAVTGEWAAGSSLLR